MLRHMYSTLPVLRLIASPYKTAAGILATDWSSFGVTEE
jgi:hypothetical protein